MPTLTIRNLDQAVKHRLRVRAAEHGVSMEEEARSILREAVAGGSEIRGDKVGLPAEVGEWHLNVSLEELMKLSVKPEQPFDLKAVSDELYDYLDNE